MRRSLLTLAIAAVFASSFALGLTERTETSSDQLACGGTKPKPKPDNAEDDDKKPKPSKPPTA